MARNFCSSSRQQIYGALLEIYGEIIDIIGLPLNLLNFYQFCHERFAEFLL